MNTGDRVRYSSYALRAAREYWLAQGQYSAKNRAKAALDRQAALRGTVVEIILDTVKVQWDNGTVITTLPYRLEMEVR